MDNVSPTCDVRNMVEFVTNLGVRVLSCYEVTSRHNRGVRRGQSQSGQLGEGQPFTPSSKAFRLCINRADIALLLRADFWPNDITSSKWYFVNEPNKVVAEPVDRVATYDINEAVASAHKQNSFDKAVFDKEIDLDAGIHPVNTSNRFDVLQSSDIEMDNDATIIDTFVSNSFVSDQPLATCSPINPV